MSEIVSKIKSFFKGSAKKNASGKEIAIDSNSALKIEGDKILLKDQRRGSSEDLLKSRELAVEISEDAKYLIASKIARLLPDMVTDKKIALVEYTLRVLKALSKDQVLRVRKIIADELKSAENVPHELILMLAWDEHKEVALPVIEFSPVLTDDDLIEIILSSKIPDAVNSVAKRNKVSTRVTDAIVNKGAVTAITTALSNKGASFSEESLEIVADKGMEHKNWHEPIIARPELSIKVINKLAVYISDSLVLQMLESGKISEDTASEIMSTIRGRLSSAAKDKKVVSKRKADELFNYDLLNPEVIAEAIERNEKDFVMHGISLLSGIDKDRVAMLFAADNPKIVIAICWKAGLSMRSATQAQLRIAGIHHTKVINPRNGNEYPFTDEQLRDYLELIA